MLLVVTAVVSVLLGVPVLGVAAAAVFIVLFLRRPRRARNKPHLRTRVRNWFSGP
jgi:hypothetical protein